MNTKHTSTLWRASIAAMAFVAGLTVGMQLQSHVDQQTTAYLLRRLPTGTPLPSHAPRRTLVAIAPEESVPMRSAAPSSRRFSLRNLPHISSLHRAAPVVRSVASSEPASSSGRSADGADAFGTPTFPITRIPAWGSMRDRREQWDWTYDQFPRSALVPAPPYNLSNLTIPTEELARRTDSEAEEIMTEKLFYSTRFFGRYDIDGGEFEGLHAGIDLKAPDGTPIRSVGNGTVVRVWNDDILGLAVAVEHDHPTYGRITVFYGHLSSAAVQEGDRVTSGQLLGAVGHSGNASGPHLHWQVDYAHDAPAEPYMPAVAPTKSEALRHSINPLALF